MTATIPLSESTKADLKAKIDASLLARNAALARNDLPAAERYWIEHVSLLEVQMGRVERPGELTPEAGT